VVNRLAEIPLEFEPGSRWEYSVSFDVLGRLVEVVSGKTLDVFLKDQIFDPLEMEDTGFCVPESKQCRFVSLYQCMPQRQAAVARTTATRIRSLPVA
jgi:CubicO group peptidase (beta-lactamase class C family)